MQALIADDNRTTAHLAILDVALSAFGKVEHHRNRLVAKGAGEKMLEFHTLIVIKSATQATADSDLFFLLSSVE